MQSLFVKSGTDAEEGGGYQVERALLPQARVHALRHAVFQTWAQNRAHVAQYDSITHLL
jgi:hypothetical protein